jgi:hypothetical protein
MGAVIFLADGRTDSTKIETFFPLLRMRLKTQYVVGVV